MYIFLFFFFSFLSSISVMFPSGRFHFICGQTEKEKEKEEKRDRGKRGGLQHSDGLFGCC